MKYYHLRSARELTNNNPVDGPSSCLTCAGIEKDPKIITETAQEVSIYLKENEWTSLFWQDRCALVAHPVEMNGTKFQWLNGLAVFDLGTNQAIVNVTVPHDVPTGSLGE